MGDEENVEPPSKRRKISLSLPKDRFNFSVDDEELKEAMKTYSGKKYGHQQQMGAEEFRGLV